MLMEGARDGSVAVELLRLPSSRVFHIGKLVGSAGSGKRLKRFLGDAVIP